MRVLLHAEFLHLVSRIQNFQTSLMKKGGCVVTLGIQFLNFFLKLDLKDNLKDKSFSIAFAGLKGNHYIND